MYGLPMGTTNLTKILFFGSLADSLGRERLVAIPPEGCTLRELRGTLCAGDAAASSALGNARVRVAVNQEIAFDDRRVYPGQEVAFLAPVSGG